MKALLGARPQLFLPQVTGGKVGEIILFGGSDEPQDWLFCDGRAISRQTFEELFAVIGTTFGAGDGSTTFNIPDFKGRAPIGAGQGTGLTARTLGTQNIGAETHTLNADQMPSHIHKFQRQQWYGADSEVPGTGTGSIYSWKSGTGGTTSKAYTNSNTAMYGPTGGGQAHNNMQPSTVVNFIICFKARAAGEGGTTSVDKITAGEIDYITNL